MKLRMTLNFQLPVHPPPILPKGCNYRHAALHMALKRRAAANWTLGFTSAMQALYCLSHIPSPTIHSGRNSRENHHTICLQGTTESTAGQCWLGPHLEDTQQRGGAPITTKHYQFFWSFHKWTRYLPGLCSCFDGVMVWLAVALVQGCNTEKQSVTAVSSIGTNLPSCRSAQRNQLPCAFGPIMMMKAYIWGSTFLSYIIR